MIIAIFIALPFPVQAGSLTERPIPILSSDVLNRSLTSVPDLGIVPTQIVPSTNLKSTSKRASTSRLPSVYIFQSRYEPINDLTFSADLEDKSKHFLHERNGPDKPEVLLKWNQPTDRQINYGENWSRFSAIFTDETTSHTSFAKKRNNVDGQDDGQSLLFIDHPAHRRILEPTLSSEKHFALSLSLAILLAILSAVFSGLTLGLMVLDVVQLRVIIQSAEKQPDSAIARRDGKRAKRIYRLRKDGNLLLVTLLVSNVSVNAAFSIIASDLTSGVVGFLLSAVILTLFGEIIPQAICNRYGLLFGYYLCPFVWLTELILYIIVKPIAMVLDFFLGKMTHVFKSLLDDGNWDILQLMIGTFSLLCSRPRSRSIVQS